MHAAFHAAHAALSIVITPVEYCGNLLLGMQLGVFTQLLEVYREFT